MLGSAWDGGQGEESCSFEQEVLAGLIKVAFTYCISGIYEPLPIVLMDVSIYLDFTNVLDTNSKR